MNEHASPVLTPLEVAELLMITRNTVYELIRRGELNAYRAGRKVRIDRAEVDAYKRRTMSRPERVDPAASAMRDAPGQEVLHQDPLRQDASRLDTSRQDAPRPDASGSAYPSRSEFPLRPPVSGQVVICGQDLILDTLSRHLQMHPAGTAALRSFAGSYDGLVALYRDEVQMTTVHLWDGETDTYNLPFVRRLLPGIPSVILHLARRTQGFYVTPGNPLRILGWSDLARSGLLFVNREKGSGTRILLDERLRMLGLAGTDLHGYGRESTSHLAVAATVARGGADFGLGSEKAAMQVRGVDFVPLQVESLALVLKRTRADEPLLAAVLEILRSEAFRSELEGIGGYDLARLGDIEAEL